MFNYMLDRYPSTYEGYLIRTDFRIGIQISLCFNDVDLTQEEKLGTALNLLYGYGCPPLEIALEGLKWFMSMGVTTNKKAATTKENKEVLYDFDFDSGRLYSAFRKVFNIDLSRINLHWFEFGTLLGDLTDCAFARAIEIRTKKITSNMSTEEKQYYTDAKAAFKIPDKVSAEEQAQIDKFFELAKAGET